MTSPTLADRDERFAQLLAERRHRLELRRKEEARRGAFAEAFGAREIKWSGYNLAPLLRATGERPERVEQARRILDRIGLDSGCGRRWPGTGGVFDHGDMWARDGKPWALVGHPYDIRDDEHALLDELARTFPTLRVSTDDRPSYYGFETHHVRVELAEARRPFEKPPATPKTRAAARAARKAFAEVLPVPGG